MARKVWFILLALASILMAITSMNCVVEQSVHLIIDNQTKTDINLTFYVVQQDGQLSSARILGVIHAEQIERTTGTVILGGIGLEQKVELRADDLLGNVIWQKTWSGQEFLKLKDSGWEIDINSQPS